MVRACCVCKAGTKVDSHKFPQNPAKCKKWIESLHMPELNLLSAKELQKRRVCYKHFSADDYKPTRGIRQLKDAACPERSAHCEKINDGSNVDDPASGAANCEEDVFESMEHQEISNKEYNEDIVRRQMDLEVQMDLVLNQAKQQAMVTSTLEDRVALVEKTVSAQTKMLRRKQRQVRQSHLGTTTRQAVLSPNAKSMYILNMKLMKEVKRLKRLRKSDNERKKMPLRIEFDINLC